MTSAEIGEVQGHILFSRPAEGEGYIIPQVSTAGGEKKGDQVLRVAISVLVSI